MLTKTLEQTYFVIDFDSTFTKVEALDVLGEISLAGHRDRAARRLPRDVVRAGGESRAGGR